MNVRKIIMTQSPSNTVVQHHFGDLKGLVTHLGVFRTEAAVTPVFTFIPHGMSCVIWSMTWVGISAHSR